MIVIPLHVFTSILDIDAQGFKLAIKMGAFHSNSLGNLADTASRLFQLVL